MGLGDSDVLSRYCQELIILKDPQCLIELLQSDSLIVSTHVVNHASNTVTLPLVTEL